MATQCTEVEVVWSMKGLIGAFRVLDSDVVGAALTEWLSINRSTNEVLAKAIRADIESKLKAESAPVSRACALVQVSLSDTVRRDIAAANLEKCAHCIITKLRGKYCSDEQKHATAISVYQRLHAFKFRPHASLDANLQAFDKLRTAVEKLEGHPLSDSHLASALLAALPSYDGLPSHLANYPQVVAVDELKADPAAPRGPPGYAPGGRPGYASMGQGGHSGYASFNHGDYRDDQRGRSPFRQSASRYRSRSGDRYRDYRGYYRDDRVTYRDDRGTYRADSGANQDDRHYRIRSHSMYDDRRHRSRSALPADQGYDPPASTSQRSQSRSASR
ncbi:hypothetical protein DYB28_007722, partial [Aphanomyces astaci]